MMLKILQQLLKQIPYDNAVITYFLFLMRSFTDEKKAAFGIDYM